MDYETETNMRRLVVQKLGRYRQSLEEYLGCEDYEQEGILDLTQLIEAIRGIEEDLDDHVLDYMLYYVYVRSDSVDKLEYKLLLGMLDEESRKRERTASAKQRPESKHGAKMGQPAASADSS